MKNIRFFLRNMQKPYNNEMCKTDYLSVCLSVWVNCNFATECSHSDSMAKTE